MSNIGRLSVEIDLDTGKITKGIANTQSKMSAFTVALGSLMADMARQLARAALDFGKNSLKLASDLQETNQKFGVVFSSLKAESESAATSLAENFGLSELAAKQLLSNTGDLLTGFEFTEAEALKLSIQVNELAADLASFSNVEGGAETASIALTKALLGEAESAKSVGVVINQNTDEYKKLVKHYTTVEGKTMLQAKAYAALTIATNQSKKAIGDFARSSQSYANQQRILTANIEDFQTQLGSFFLPMVTELFQYLNTNLLPALQMWIGDFKGLDEHTNILSTTLSNIIKVIMGVVTAFSLVGESIGTLTAIAYKLFTGDFKGALDVAEIGIDDLKEKIMNAGEAMKKVANEDVPTAADNSIKNIENVGKAFDDMGAKAAAAGVASVNAASAASTAITALAASTAASVTNSEAVLEAGMKKINETLGITEGGTKTSKGGELVKTALTWMDIAARGGIVAGSVVAGGGGLPAATETGCLRRRDVKGNERQKQLFGMPIILQKAA